MENDDILECITFINNSIYEYRKNALKVPECILLSKGIYESLPFKCNAIFYEDGVALVNYKEFLDKLEKETFG